MATERFTNEYIDYTNGYLRSGNWTNNGAGVSALLGAMAAATNSNVAVSSNVVPIIGTSTATDTLYGSVQDTAVFVFVTSALTQVRLVIPAPMSTMFVAGGLTIDPTSALAAAIIAAAIGTLSDVNGNLVMAYVSGTKSSRKSEQNG